MKTRTILYADEGKILTNGEIYGRQIFLSENENPNLYREIGELEYKEKLAEEENDGNV